MLGLMRCCTTPAGLCNGAPGALGGGAKLAQEARLLGLDGVLAARLALPDLQPRLGALAVRCMDRCTLKEPSAALLPPAISDLFPRAQGDVRGAMYFTVPTLRRVW
mmetsp:Transcript_26448/g.53641  ORF Transcript_26448/g.53641 Transcript_26448/m.53641 type:complete len:106 (+) Transcript_26448:217-534(+)